MKKLYIMTLIILLGFGFRANAQEMGVMQREYEYDNAGNRIVRKVLILEDGSSGQKSMKNQSDSHQDDFFTDKAGDISLKIFPNPTTSSVTLEIDNLTETIAGNLEIYNFAGTRIDTREISSHTTKIDLSRYTSGTYLITVRINDKNTYWKIVKQ